MGQDENICRICLQIIDDSYSPLTDNFAVLQHLKLLSLDTGLNLDLTEEPLICSSCDSRLKKLANFKETIVVNESKLRTYQTTDLTEFLKTLSDDVDSICRLCLKSVQSGEKLQKNWLERKELLKECDIQMDVDINVPTKLCQACDVYIQTMVDFKYLYTDNESTIADAAAKGKLAPSDLLSISMAKEGTLKKSQTEDNNNLLRKQDKKELASKAKSETQPKKIIKNKQPSSSVSTSSNKGKSNIKQKKSIMDYMIKNTKDDTINLTPKGQQQTKSQKPVEKSFNVTKIPKKTYKSKRKTTNSFDGEQPSTSKAAYLTPKQVADRKCILKKINEQLRLLHTSIDASPMSNLADITLEVDDDGLVQEETPTEFNVTQELIDVLEGRLNDKPISYATQELLDILEGKEEDECIDAIVVDDDEAVKVEVDAKPKGKRGRPPKAVALPNNDLDVKKSPIKKTYSKLSKSDPEPTAPASNEAVNIIEIVNIPKQPKKPASKSSKVNETAPKEKRQRARQKTIVTSFKDILKNENLSENPVEGAEAIETDETSTTTQALKKAKAAPKKRAIKTKTGTTDKTSFKDILKNEENLSENPVEGAVAIETDETSTTTQAPKKAKAVPKKRAIKTKTGTTDKTSFKDILKNEENLSENPVEGAVAIETDETSTTTQAPKKAKAAPKKRAIKTKTGTTDKTSPPQKKWKNTPRIRNNYAKTDRAIKKEAMISVIKTEEVPLASSDDDEFVEEDLEQKFENRPVQITIIKGKKRTNKAQLNKTWQELTGSSSASSASVPSSVPTTGSPVVLGGDGMEIQIVKKKRGRPALPESERKNPTKVKRILEWLYCDKCSFQTYAKNSFVQHQLIHNVMSTIPMLLHCNYDCCRFSTTNDEELMQHKTTHDLTHLSYKCVFCDEVFKKKSSCMYHTLRHDDQDVASQFYAMVYNGATDEEYFECFQCMYQNVEESVMPDHVIDHTVETPKNPLIAKFKCTECTYRTKSKETLERHIKNHEETKKKAKEKADAKRPSAKIKKEPTEEVKDMSSTEMGQGPLLSCDLCHYVTRNKRSLANHRGLKHKRLVQPQTYDGMSKTEEAAKAGRPIYYCNDCSYSTHRKLNMPRHALVHRTKENMEFFECPHCIFETKHRRSFTRHLEVKHGVVL